MTNLPHDCEVRLTMLQETIERNRENLLDHEVEERTFEQAEMSEQATSDEETLTAGR